MRAVDARVEYTAESIQAAKFPLEGLTLQLTLEDGEMRLEPLRFDLAEGKLEATARLDGRTDMIGGDIDLSVRQIKLNQLLSRFDIDIADIELEQEGTGTFSGRAELEVNGNSIDEMAASADGQILVVMDGGRINALIVEAIGLDVGEAVALLLSGDDEQESEMVPIQCLVGQFDVESGVIRSKAMVLETTDSTITGAGTINLDQETLDLTIEAHPHDASVLSASTPVRIVGPFRDPNIDLVSEELEEKSLAALALGTVLPVIGAVLPFLESGEEEGETAERKCQRLLTSAEESMSAASSSGTAR
jgi:uncharacterized protein involved in outer membrane biogenesis